jgi:DNA-directed RNA polymerase specialized sigma24 family protein
MSNSDGRARPRGDEAELFHRHHQRLLGSVSRAVCAPDAVVEDACAFAWQRLIETQPQRSERIFGWLRKVAIHEAWRLARNERREAPPRQPGQSGDQDGAGDVWESLIPSRWCLEQRLEALAALRLLASLPEKQRDYLSLLIAGFSYAEIQELRFASLTNVNKHLVKARARIRWRESEAA